MSKWPPFHRWHCQLPFHPGKWLYLAIHFQFGPKGTINIKPADQAISHIWTNNYLIIDLWLRWLWRIVLLHFPNTSEATWTISGVSPTRAFASTNSSYAHYHMTIMTWKTFRVAGPHKTATLFYLMLNGTSCWTHTRVVRDSRRLMVPLHMVCAFPSKMWRYPRIQAADHS